jgi:ATP-dependent Lhr-like helicase
VFQGYPGEKRSNKQLQASSSLFYEVFRKYDPDNRLLAQAQSELLADELDIARLQHSLARMQAQQLVIKPLARPTPFSFPLMVERLREKLSNESMADRIARMVQQLEKDAGGDAGAPGVLDISQALALGKDTLTSSKKRPRTSRRKTP